MGRTQRSPNFEVNLLLIGGLAPYSLPYVGFKLCICTGGSEEIIHIISAVKLTSMRSEDIKNRKWTDAERLAVRRPAERQAAGKRSLVNLEDIPRLTDEQLANMVRLRDARKPKVAVSVRLDPPVPEWLQSKGDGHWTRINDILSRLMEAERGKKPRVTGR